MPQLERLRQLWLGSILLTASVCTGCYQPTTAPPIKYDQQQAGELRTELEKMDWE